MVGAAYDIRTNLERDGPNGLMVANYLGSGFFARKYLKAISPSVAGNGVPQDPQAAREPESGVEFSIVTIV